jgi:hypothetical protein
MPKIEVGIDVKSIIAGTPDHFSYEEDSSLSLHIYLLITYSIIFGVTVWSYHKFS